MQLRLHHRYHNLFWRWMKHGKVPISDDIHELFIEAEYQLERAVERVDLQNEGRGCDEEYYKSQH